MRRHVDGPPGSGGVETSDVIPFAVGKQRQAVAHFFAGTASNLQAVAALLMLPLHHLERIIVHCCFCPHAELVHASTVTRGSGVEEERGQLG
eukprot:jgi/Botrbrau1/16866/Bobra.150_2s0085.1